MTAYGVRIAGPQYVIELNGLPWAVFIVDDNGHEDQAVRLATYEEAQETADDLRWQARKAIRA